MVHRFTARGDYGTVNDRYPLNEDAGTPRGSTQNYETLSSRREKFPVTRGGRRVKDLPELDQSVNSISCVWVLSSSPSALGEVKAGAWGEEVGWTMAR